MNKDFTVAEEKIEVTQEFLDGVEEVYCAVTGNQLSKLNTDPKHIISCFEGYFIPKVIVVSDLNLIFEEAITVEEFKKYL